MANGYQTAQQTGEKIEENEARSVVAKAKEILLGLGVTETQWQQYVDGVTSFGGNPTIVAETVVEDDSQAALVARTIQQQFPGPKTSYEVALEEFPDVAGVRIESPEALGESPELLKHFQATDQQFTTAGYYVGPETGAIKFRNGVIVTPEGQVVYPSEAVPGSPQWLQKIQDEWDPEKINAWRHRLQEFGYDAKYALAEKGGWDQQLLSALSDYHANRYINFGKPIPLTQGSEALKARDVLDPATMRNRITAQFRRIYADDPTHAELKEWMGFWQRNTGRQLREGVEPGEAIARGEERFIEDFENDPQTQFFVKAQEENTELRDQLLSTFQAISSLT